MKAELGPNVEIQLHCVSEMPTTSSGKRDYVISDLPVDFTVRRPTSPATPRSLNESLPAAGIHIPHPNRDFGATSKSRSSHELVVNRDHEPWVQQVYDHARSIATAGQYSRVIAIGCGSGDYLVDSFRDAAIDLVGMDFPQCLVVAPENRNRARWIRCFLNSINHLEHAFEQFTDDAPQLIIVAAVLEQLPDPRPLLNVIRTLLKRHPDNCCCCWAPWMASASTAKGSRHCLQPGALANGALPDLTCFSVVSSSGFKFERASRIHGSG